MILPASYANGFAPRDGQAVWPELWRGCVGAWNPGLGPTGLVLRDWSGYGNHGTLTNMDAGTDWVRSQNRYALDFDGANDFVSVANNNAINITRSISVSVWIKRTTSQIGKGIVGKYNTTTNQRAWALYTANDGIGLKAQFTCQSNGASFNANQVASTFDTIGGDWVHLCGVLSAGSTCQIYTQGILRGTAASTTPAIAACTGALEIGTYNQSTANCFTGQIDDLLLYNRALSPNEVCLLAQRRGISYELAPRHWSAAMIDAYRRRTQQYQQLVGGGVL